MTRLLPSTIGHLAQAFEEIAHTRIQAIEVPIEKMWRVDECPESLLPYLADALSCEIWDSDWPEEKKRKTLNSWLAIRARRGTPYAVKEALAQLGVEADIIESWQASGSPKTFDIVYWFDENTPEKIASPAYLEKLVESLKPVSAKGNYVGSGSRARVSEIPVMSVSVVEVMAMNVELVR